MYWPLVLPVSSVVLLPVMQARLSEQYFGHFELSEPLFVYAQIPNLAYCGLFMLIVIQLSDMLLS